MLGRRTIVDYGSGYNMMGTSRAIGQEVPGEPDGGSVRDVLGPDTEAGQALWVAGIGLGILVLTVGAGQKGILGKGGAVLQMVAMVAAASWVANYLTRVQVARHPNMPLGMGLAFDA